MSTLQTLVSSNDFPLLIAAVGFVAAGVIVLGVAVFVSLRTRTAAED